LKAWRVTELGDPKEALSLEAEEPSPKVGEVMVEAEAAAMNFFDILLFGVSTRRSQTSRLPPRRDVGDYLRSRGRCGPRTGPAGDPHAAVPELPTLTGNLSSNPRRGQRSPRRFGACTPDPRS
jgi:NADPH2:quinone reductase